MAKVKLTYFDFPGSRGEECRLALHLAGVEFEDRRLKGAEWAELKPSTPFGALPVLEIEGRGSLGECNAILAFIGRGHGMHPSDSWQAARHEALMSAVEQLRHQLSATNPLSPDDKKAARETLLQGALPRFGASVEAQLGDGPFVAGEHISVVDLKLFIIVRALVSGDIDHIPPTVFADYPRLMKLYHAVETHPKVVEWTSR